MSTFYQLDFERPLRDLEARLEAAEQRADSDASVEVPALAGVVADTPPAPEDVEELRRERAGLIAQIYAELDPWQTVRVARHPARPQTPEYVERIARDFVELHGDRRYADDPAVLTGFGRIGEHKCLIVGHRKGRTTQEKLACHFGCAHPEGYRKALLKMKTAEKFGVPIVTLVDTPGAYPGLGAEERGQAEAIAVNLREMSRIRVPIVSVVIGEGGSGGALGIAVADRVAMLQFAWYSVISPEGCAAILWKEANDRTNRAAAEALRLTASDNKRLGIVDDVIREPIGAAHRDPDAAADALRDWIDRTLSELVRTDPDELIARRYDRFRNLGSFEERVGATVEARSSTPE